ncbi:MAG TPA: helix-turn-helix domain-containing protein [Thermoanaerobaculia bacterium]|nr:helix-turn-helix domain-containing protein [Thermoanaerobaculia bacterium]
MPDQEPQGQGGASELASFGEELRREREIRGISLKEIADATKISKRFLDALERNDHRTLPAPVFTRGFVREYSRYVGLNAEEMVNRYNFAAANDDRIEKPPQVEKYPQTPVRDISPKPPRKRGIPPVYARIDRNLVAAAFIAIALAGVAWWAVQHRRADSESAESVATVTTAPVPAPIVPPKPVIDDSTLHLAVEAVDNAWVVLEADGKTVVNEEMVRGDRRTFEANDAFRFRNIGNAAGLKLTLNGAVIPPLGADGEVIRNRIFDRAALEKIRGAGPETPQTQS